MEDAATAEISRTIVAGIPFTKPLENGQYLTKENYLKWQDEELEKIKEYGGAYTIYRWKSFALVNNSYYGYGFEKILKIFSLTLKAYKYI